MSLVPHEIIEIFALLEKEKVKKEAARPHHVWCNGSSRSPVEGCRWCDGPDGFWAKYPYRNNNEVDDLAEKHFPNAVKRT